MIARFFDSSDRNAMANYLELITLQVPKPCYVYGRVKGTEPEKHIVLDANLPDTITVKSDQSI